MGKKKQKKAPAAKCKTADGISTTPPHAFISSLSKVMFILLSIGGHFDANDYNKFLETFSIERHVDIHNDDEIDEIIDAMEYHEEGRVNLSTSMRNLSVAITEFSKTLTKNENHIDDNDQVMISFEKIESCCSKLSAAISVYKPLIEKQRQLIVRLNSFMKETLSLTKLRCKDENRSLHVYHAFFRYGLIFQTLSEQYLRQLHWENSVLSKAEDILRQGSLYSQFDGIVANSNNINVDGGANSVSSDVILHQNFRIWSEGIVHCSMLQHHLWSSVREKLIKDLTAKAVNKMKMTREPAERSTEEKEDIHMKNAPPKQFHPKMFPEVPLSSMVSWNMESVLKARSVKSLFNKFLNQPIFNLMFDGSLEESPRDVLGYSSLFTASQRNTDALFCLLTGSSGSGKSHFCHEIETRIKRLNSNLSWESQIVVLRPQVPSDFLGSAVGAFEDSVISLFSYIEVKAKSNKCVLLLDGMEHILGPEWAENMGKAKIGSVNAQGDHLSFRARNVFLNVMERIRSNYCSGESSKSQGVLVLCTSRSHNEDIANRFDKIFHLDSPNNEERENLVEQGLGLDNVRKDEVNKKLTDLVIATVGKSRGEIAQCCRKVVDSIPCSGNSKSDLPRLELMQATLQIIMPDSIKNGPHGGSVEISVFSAKELRRGIEFDKNGNVVFPLMGDNAIESWKQLENIIIAPLCRKDELDVLLYGEYNASKKESQRKATSSGVLLKGPSGAGKTAIARHCAAVAAGYDPNIKLLEVACTSIIEKEVGGSERNIHKLFQIARDAAPCILLLDGIENIAPVRGHDNTTEGTMDRLLSTLLTEMDGVRSNHASTNKDEGRGIAIIGITHRSSSWIDPALLRPGRLEKCIELQKPNYKARKEIFFDAVKTLNIDFSSASFFDPKDNEALSEAVALKTDGKSAAEIIAICETAKMLTLKETLHASSPGPGLSENLSVPYHHLYR